MVPENFPGFFYTYTKAKLLGHITFIPFNRFACTRNTFYLKGNVNVNSEPIFAPPNFQSDALVHCIT